MNQETHAFETHFAFTVAEPELMGFRRLIVRNHKQYLSLPRMLGFLLSLLPLVLIPIGAAAYYGWAPLGPALFICEVSYAAGLLACAMAMTVSARRTARAVFLASRSARTVLKYEFAEDGIAIEIGPLQSRITWSAISSLESTDALVVLWHDPTQGFFIPTRAFRDKAARDAFIAWASQRVAANAGRV